MLLNSDKTLDFWLGHLDLGRGEKSKPLNSLNLKMNLLVSADLRENLDEEMVKVGGCEGIKRN